MFRNNGSKGSGNGQKGMIPTCQSSIRDFSDDPVVKTLLSNAGSAGSIPGQGAKTPKCLVAKK